MAIFYGIIGAIFTLFFMYLDTRLLDNPKSKSTYIKTMLMVGLIVGLLTSWLTCTGGTGGGGSSSGGGFGTQYLPGISEEILTGPPSF